MGVYEYPDAEACAKEMNDAGATNIVVGPHDVRTQPEVQGVGDDTDERNLHHIHVKIHAHSHTYYAYGPMRTDDFFFTPSKAATGRLCPEASPS